MIKMDTTLPITTKCTLLNVSRSTVYYQTGSTEPDAEELKLCRFLDELHIRFPWMGSRSLVDQLKQKQGLVVNRKRVRRLMRLMGIHAVYPGPRTSVPGQEHRIYPYLLRNLSIDRPNQVWAADITYIPMQKGFLYLVVIMDWYSRRILSWRLSNSLDTGFCLDALEEALRRHGRPEIFNTDQGGQFTSEEFTGRLKEVGVRISMDGKGRWVDNVFVERIWRSLKYEEVYLHAYESVREARERIGIWIKFYNTERTHQSLDRLTPDQVYSQLQPEGLAA